MKIIVEWPDGSEEIVGEFNELNLLEVLTNNGINVANNCRRGDCLQCACLIAASPSTEFKETLCCQFRVSSDLVVRLDYNPHLELPTPRHFPVKVHLIDAVSLDIIKVILKYPKNLRLDYRPGQYIDVKLSHETTRSYSIFDVKDNEITLYIKLIKGGAFEQWMLSGPVGRVFQVFGPLGHFFISDDLLVDNTVFIATGTGIVPVYSMLRSLIGLDARRPGKILLVWGNRFYRDEFLDFNKLNFAADLNLEYIPVFSKETDAAFKGRVTDWLPKSFVSTQIYAAGNPEMLASLKKIAQAKGLEPFRMKADSFLFRKSGAVTFE
jgi:CDP-4-dehydro-6-deoxyglucose reductase